jgi:hypothetical protein
MARHADNAEIDALYDEAFIGPAEALHGMGPVVGTLAVLFASGLAVIDFFGAG